MSDANGGSGPDPRALDNRLDALRTQIDNLADDLEAEREAREDLEAELEQRDRRIAKLEERVANVDSRTDLLNLVDAADDVTGEQRSVALLQHLKRQAERSKGADTAGVDRAGADEALHHPDVERTTVYKDMRRAARLVGDDEVCWYTDGKLRLDLRDGQLPADVLASRGSEVSR